MSAINGLFYPLIGFALCVGFIYMTLSDLRFYFEEPKMEFVGRNGTRFVVGGKEFYFNGWNSYWLMDQAVEEFSRHRVRKMFEAGSKMGLTVCRTWAFNDAGYNALQLSPGKFDQRVFKALDTVITEAQQHGIRLIFSLVNNLHAFGGKAQYVHWAREEHGTGSSVSNDSFFYDPDIKSNFKNYIAALLTRKNSFTGIEYKNDPTIFAWELMNEPRCVSDPSGNSLHDWIKEMAEFFKSIDKNHLLTVGTEGFYGTTTEKRHINPGDWSSSLGTDFIRDSKISSIDFASVHTYPDNWLPYLKFEQKMDFVSKWISSHIDDGDNVLHKPVLFTEFGLSSAMVDFKPGQRYLYYKKVYDLIYESAKVWRSGAGAMAWQFLVDGMDEYGDAFAIVPWTVPSLHKLITRQSCRLAVTCHRANSAKFLATCSKS